MIVKRSKKFIFVVVVLLLLTSIPAFQKAYASTSSPKQEMRAIWIATVSNIDMKAGMNQSQYTNWVQTTLDKVKADHFNTVIFQVKPQNDALYPSKLAPWSSYLTGKKQGTNPGYDPLQIMLNEAHKRGLELHAWVNPYRVTVGKQTLSSLAADHIAKKNPSWVIQYDGKYYLNPGLPTVQQYIASVVKELVTNYDLDAVQMDDYFYPGKNVPDQATFKAYGTGFKKIEDWRRNNVNTLLKNVYGTIKAVKPSVQFGISPRGIWRNQANDSTGSKTNGATNYDDIFADTRQWLKDGSIDYIAPQIYWSRNHKTANYTALLNWWNSEVQTYAKVHPVNLYIGLADYKVGNKAEYGSDTAFANQKELPGQIADNRNAAHVKGQMHYSLSKYNKDLLGYATYLKQQLYQNVALTPAVSWKGAAVPLQPQNVQVTKGSAGMQVTITDPNSSQTRKYVIYRFKGTIEGSYDDPRNIVDVVYNTDGHTVYIDKTAQKDGTYTYGVTSLSPTGVESTHAFVLVDGKAEAAAPKTFHDVNTAHRSYKEIDYLAQSGVVKGTTTGYFYPESKITRSEFTMMLGRALGLEETPQKTKFTDVGIGMTGSGLIQSAVDKGYINGYKDGTFKPYDPITRGDMALIITRAFGYPTDGSTSGAATALLTRGIDVRQSDGSFAVKRAGTREEMAIFMARAMNPDLRVTVQK
ncbi:family 10 glycosylhydrolase [Bacillus sp. 1P06AnD]|uniref:family 10 glycosylhydrolase n=1 Tax=Bacillus sp. 1P06AnD TaxID=3132208 RepID=UPI0039A31CE6